MHADLLTNGFTEILHTRSSTLRLKVLLVFFKRLSRHDLYLSACLMTVYHAPFDLLLSYAIKRAAHAHFQSHLLSVTLTGEPHAVQFTC